MVHFFKHLSSCWKDFPNKIGAFAENYACVNLFLDSAALIYLFIPEVIFLLRFFSPALPSFPHPSSPKRTLLMNHLCNIPITGSVFRELDLRPQTTDMQVNCEMRYFQVLISAGNKVNMERTGLWVEASLEKASLRKWHLSQVQSNDNISGWLKGKENNHWSQEGPGTEREECWVLICNVMAEARSMMVREVMESGTENQLPRQAGVYWKALHISWEFLWRKD